MLSLQSYFQCANCNREAVAECSLCRRTPYCTTFCQRKDWASHQVECVRGVATDAGPQQSIMLIVESTEQQWEHVFYKSLLWYQKFIMYIIYFIRFVIMTLKYQLYDKNPKTYDKVTFLDVTATCNVIRVFILNLVIMKLNYTKNEWIFYILKFNKIIFKINMLALIKFYKQNERKLKVKYT